MGKYEVTSGVLHAPVKVVLYGPEGIGKTTFASSFPDPLFIDTEGGTKTLDVHRLPPPQNWEMLLDEVAAAMETPCKTLVLDTADWAERLCIRAVCERGKVRGIESFGYGKGYTYAKEEFARLLAALDAVNAAGKQVVVTAHAQLSKFEQPDEMGSYDRWAMKTSKQVAPLLREWCDMLLFANYKTFVVKDGKSAKGKAQGGQRVMYTTHHPCWDAKNRFGLPDELPLDYAAIAPVIEASTAQESPAPQAAPPTAPPRDIANAPAPDSDKKKTSPKCPYADRLFQKFNRSQSIKDLCPWLSIHRTCHKDGGPEGCSRLDRPTPAQPEPAPPAPQAQPAAPVSLDEELRTLGVPDSLRALMVRDGVTDEQLRLAVFQKGACPQDMPIRDYDPTFAAKFLPEHWAEVLQTIQQYGDIPF